MMATNEIPIPRDPTEDEALALFKAIEEKFPSKSLGNDKWYVLLVRIAIYNLLVHAEENVVCGHGGRRSARLRTSTVQGAHQAT
jgi:hypothetical protein